MSNLRFILDQMAALRYYIPLIKEGNRLGLKSQLHVYKTQKYHNPASHKHLLEEMAFDHGFVVNYRRKIEDKDSIVFSIEGVNIDNISSCQKSVAITSMRDFTVHYDHYIDDVDHVCMPSEFFAQYFKKESPKNLYFGSPKYDVVIDPDSVRRRYRVGEKNALVIFPRVKYLNGKLFTVLQRAYESLHQMGYSIIVKTRGKDPIQSGMKNHELYRGDTYVEDFSWYPHSTMELMSVSDFVVNFDSTASKECVMMDVPFINFCVKSSRRFDFLYDYDYVINLAVSADVEKIKRSIEKIMSTDLKGSFQESREKHLFEKGDVSKNILEKLL